MDVLSPAEVLLLGFTCVALLYVRNMMQQTIVTCKYRKGRNENYQQYKIEMPDEPIKYR